MGMFDDVICEASLPDEYLGKNFQTKDLDCIMAKLKITEDGRLLRCLSWRDENWIDLDFHGILNFYTMDTGMYVNRRGWHEYNAKFTDGQLVEITPVSKEPA